MPDTPASETPQYRPLHFIGDVAAGRYLANIGAHDFTAEQAEKWLGPEKYALALDSDYYEPMTQAEARTHAAAPTRRPRRRGKKE